MSALAVTTSHAIPAPPLALRSPQVPVLTNHLQSLMDGVGESIRVDTDQRQAQSFPATQFSCGQPPTWLLEVAQLSANTDSIGIYNAAEAMPVMMRVFPAEASTGWFATVAFRTAPTRLVVNAFDASANYLGRLTYLGVDETNVAFWLQGPAGRFYMQDARNPGGVAQMLLFAATGVNTARSWICMEDQLVGGGSDQDYADAVVFIESQCGDPVKQATWGAPKQRFR